MTSRNSFYANNHTHIYGFSIRLGSEIIQDDTRRNSYI